MATLGQMSLYALIVSADDEAKGLDDFIETLDPINSDQKRWLKAYVTSIRVRLTVAEMKVHSGR